MSDISGYSEIANEQLDEIETSDADLYNDVCVLCEFILDHPDKAQSLSSALTTKDGIRFRLAVPGHHPYKVFWSSSGPRIEAVFPYP
ncbi:MAG: hypothetical protein WA614_05645 [Acidimicrobiales bacterium]|jgi:hypothetical protein